MKALPLARPGRSFRAPARRWLARYVPPEIAGTSAAIAAAVVAHGAGRGGAVVAAAWAETAAFYAYVLARELRVRRRVVPTLRGLVAEFGVAEIADTVVVRPLFMGLFVAALGSLVPGVVAGKLAADVVFYALAIPAYELYARREP